MGLPVPSFNPNKPIPNTTFTSPQNFYVNGPWFPIEVGEGVVINTEGAKIANLSNSGVLDFSGVTGAINLYGGTGISVTKTNSDFTITNDGVVQLIAGGNISISGSNGVYTISASDAQTGTVTSVGTGAGLTGGPITTAGTISLDSSGVTPGSYTYPTITVDSYGRVTVAANGAAPVVTVNGTAPIQVTGSAPTLNISVDAASTSASGVVQLNDSTTSTSTTQALTAAQGKNLQDQISALAFTSNITLGGTYNASTGLVDSVTTQGTVAGLTVGSPLPTPATANNEIFVIIDVQGSTGPSGTPPYHVGDWFLSNGIVWQFLNVGYQPGQATTLSQGTVQLATDAQVQAGTDSSNAVVSSSLQSKLSDSTSTTSSTTIASSTAVKAAYDAAIAAQSFPATPTVAGLVLGCTTLDNVALGCNALVSRTTGASNVAVGGAALDSLTTGVNNIGVGLLALSSVTTTTDNTAIGNSTLAASTGAGNVAVGNIALCASTTGFNNTALGLGAGMCSTGNENLFLGYSAGCALTTGSRNVIIGNLAQAPSATGSCQLVIGTAGFNWLTGCSNGNIDPAFGIVDCAGSAGTVGQVLMSTGANQVCWGTASGGSGIPCSTITAKGDIVVGTASSTPAALPAGTNGQILYACSTATSGLCWASAAPAAAAATPTVAGLVLGCTTAARTALGCNALFSNTSGALNTAAGLNALYSNTTGGGNTAIGFCTLYYNTIGACNTANGIQALLSNTTGCCNTATGNAALYFNISGCANTATGMNALVSNTTGCQNTATGYQALCKNTTGSCNTATGPSALLNNTTGGCNVAVGLNALRANSSGCFNVSVGNCAGGTITTGCSNVAVGPNVQLVSATGSCQLAIGFSATDNWITGNSTKAIKPGAGIIDCAGSCGTSGQVLMSNGSNAICWGTVTGCTGTVTSITAGTGLTGGTITTSGTIALNTACVIQPTAFTAKGDLLSASATSTPTALGVGTDGQVLSACSACTSGLVWATPQTSPFVTYTTSAVSYTSGTPLLVAKWYDGTMQGTVNLNLNGYGGIQQLWDFYLSGGSTNYNTGWYQTASYPASSSDPLSQGTWYVDFPVYPSPDANAWMIYFSPSQNSLNPSSFTFFYRLLPGSSTPVFQI